MKTEHKEAMEKIKELAFNTTRAIDIMTTALKDTNKAVNELNRALRQLNIPEEEEE